MFKNFASMMNAEALVAPAGVAVPAPVIPVPAAVPQASGPPSGPGLPGPGAAILPGVAAPLPLEAVRPVPPAIAKTITWLQSQGTTFGSYPASTDWAKVFINEVGLTPSQQQFVLKHFADRGIIRATPLPEQSPTRRRTRGHLTMRQKVLGTAMPFRPFEDDVNRDLYCKKFGINPPQERADAHVTQKSLFCPVHVSFICKIRREVIVWCLCRLGSARSGTKERRCSVLRSMHVPACVESIHTPGDHQHVCTGGQIRKPFTGTAWWSCDQNPGSSPLLVRRGLRVC
jgi:hypothetical protein